MEKGLNFIGDLSEELQNTATKILPDIKGDVKEYKEFMDKVVKNIRAPNDVTTLFALCAISAIIFIYNISKMLGALRTHTLAKLLVVYMGLYMVAYYSGFTGK
ncbi:hypothetical protein AK88_04314 [Plasmodium fragile]|uniref:Uncharacterized protein n=1 Tax=Plasmodium fragile TaxID=5857 RepID=A0A0D9QGW8_PLAFR|nr:uncharacterized protein AK88_04314 [Plasmodium fragile]KJP86057.1 hypothetical protein AK88_04314 [Plasmodium fragile]